MGKRPAASARKALQQLQLEKLVPWKIPGGMQSSQINGHSVGILLARHGVEYVYCIQVLCKFSEAMAPLLCLKVAVKARATATTPYDVPWMVWVC